MIDFHFIHKIVPNVVKEYQQYVLWSGKTRNVLGKVSEFLGGHWLDTLIDLYRLEYSSFRTIRVILSGSWLSVGTGCYHCQGVPFHIIIVFRVDEELITCEPNNHDDALLFGSMRVTRMFYWLLPYMTRVSNKRLVLVARLVLHQFCQILSY